HRPMVGADARDRQFDRELGAVGADPAQLDLASGQRSASRGHVLAEGAYLRRPDFRRQQQLDAAAENVEPLVPEHLLGRRIELAVVELLIIVRVASSPVSRTPPCRASLSRPARYIR